MTPIRTLLIIFLFGLLLPINAQPTKVTADAAALLQAQQLKQTEQK